MRMNKVFFLGVLGLMKLGCKVRENIETNYCHDARFSRSEEKKVGKRHSSQSRVITIVMNDVLSCSWNKAKDPSGLVTQIGGLVAESFLFIFWTWILRQQLAIRIKDFDSPQSCSKGKSRDVLCYLIVTLLLQRVLVILVWHNGCSHYAFDWLGRCFNAECYLKIKADGWYTIPGNLPGE